MSVLIMWSGGVESTSLLKRYLEHSQVPVFAHYVEMVNREGRHELETAAVEALTPILQRIRPFNLSQSRLELLMGRGLAWDFQVLYPLGTVAMRHHNCKQVNRGLCYEDNWYRQEGREPQRNPFGNGEHRHATLRKACAHMLTGSETLDTVAPFLPEYEWPKALHWESLGSVAWLTHSCRRPVNGAPCGRCHSCQDRAAAMVGSSCCGEEARRRIAELRHEIHEPVKLRGSLCQ